MLDAELDIDRIEPTEIVEAFKKTGYKPGVGEYLKDGCACGIGVFLLAHDIDPIEVANSNGVCNITEVRKLNLTYVDGFISGWDHSDPEANLEKMAREADTFNCDPKPGIELYTAGFFDGYAARQRVEASGYEVVNTRNDGYPFKPWEQGE